MSAPTSPRRGLLLIATLTLSACTVDPTVYTCTVDSDCTLAGKQGGTCVADVTGRYCAFASDTCSPRLQWDQTAAPQLAGKCVNPPDMAVPMSTDGSLPDMAVTMHTDGPLPMDMTMPNPDLTGDMAKTMTPPDMSMPDLATPPDLAVIVPQVCIFDTNNFDDGCIYGM